MIGVDLPTGYGIMNDMFTYPLVEDNAETILVLCTRFVLFNNIRI
jgi:hypothetical protein